jgi:hypothetical protein
MFYIIKLLNYIEVYLEEHFAVNVYEYERATCSPHIIK